MPKKKDSTGLRIVRAEIETFKRIVAAEITPKGDVIQISGKNAAGKSSVLDAIEAALGGKKRQTKTPVQRGKEGARVVVDLGEVVVERRWTAKSDRLIVKTPDGATYDKPQERLDALVGGLAFDPLAFGRLKPAEQRATLLQLAGVDLSGFDSRRADLYQQRRDLNRDHKAAMARVGDRITGAPKERVDLAALETRLAAARAEIGANAQAKHLAALVAADARRDRQWATDAAGEIERLETILNDARTKAARLMEVANASEVEASKSEKAAAGLRDPDLDAIESEIKSTEAANELYREHAARLSRKREAKRLAEASTKLTVKIDDIDKKKTAALARARMPIDGLGVSDGGATFKGNPLEEESMSRRIRVCTAIAAALNPRLRIALIRDGNDLDDETFAAFAAYCSEAGLQAWVEKISPVGEGAIVIEAGEVKS